MLGFTRGLPEDGYQRIKFFELSFYHANKIFFTSSIWPEAKILGQFHVMDEITIEGICYIMSPSRLFVLLDTQDSMTLDMNGRTTAFSQATEMGLDFAKMP